MFDQNTGSTHKIITSQDKLHGVSPRPNHIYFSKAWPMGNVADKFYEISDTKPILSFVESRTIPGSDYINLDLSNATSGLKLYPETTGRVHEILVGFKPGNYVTQIDVPSGTPITRLPESSMIPSTTDATLKYLNAKNPEESPAFSPNLKFWAIKDMDAIVLRPVVLSGVDYELITITFMVAMHTITEVPSNRVDQCGKKLSPFNSVYDIIPYISEMRG